MKKKRRFCLIRLSFLFFLCVFIMAVRMEAGSFSWFELKAPNDKSLFQLIGIENYSLLGDNDKISFVFSGLIRWREEKKRVFESRERNRILGDAFPGIEITGFCNFALNINVFGGAFETTNYRASSLSLLMLCCLNAALAAPSLLLLWCIAFCILTRPTK